MKGRNILKNVSSNTYRIWNLEWVFKRNSLLILRHNLGTYSFGLKIWQSNLWLCLIHRFVNRGNFHAKSTGKCYGLKISCPIHNSQPLPRRNKPHIHFHPIVEHFKHGKTKTTNQKAHLRTKARFWDYPFSPNSTITLQRVVKGTSEILYHDFLSASWIFPTYPNFLHWT